MQGEPVPIAQQVVLVPALPRSVRLGPVNSPFFARTLTESTAARDQWSSPCSPNRHAAVQPIPQPRPLPLPQPPPTRSQPAQLDPAVGEKEVSTAVELLPAVGWLSHVGTLAGHVRIATRVIRSYLSTGYFGYLELSVWHGTIVSCPAPHLATRTVL
jgi:hypothetical protein